MMKFFIILILLSFIGVILGIVVSLSNFQTGSYIMFLSLSILIISSISTIFKIIENYGKNQNQD